MTLMRALSLVSSHRSFVSSAVRHLSTPSIHCDDARRVVALTWEDGGKSLHPFTWLKDTCPCASCAHPTTLNRRTTLQDLDLKCRPQNITMEASEMCIQWNDGHHSVYPFAWLKDRCFSNPKKEKPVSIKTWSKNYKPQQFQWQDLVTKDSTLCEFLLTLKSEGICLVKSAPSNNEGLEKLVGIIGFPWHNHYGQYFDVVSKNDPSNIAYTPETLSPHIDLPYFYEPPGSQFLHCVAKTSDVEGGQNQFVDGFFAADYLRQEDPEIFQLLCETPIHYWDYGSDFLKDFHLEHSQKVIQFDAKGTYSRIVFSTHFRDSKPCVSIEKVDLFYRAIRTFEDVLYQNSIEHVAEEGDIAVVNNHRVLHGRSGYKVTGNGMRHIRGSYITWDILDSRLRRLLAKLSKT